MLPWLNHNKEHESLIGQRRVSLGLLAKDLAKAAGVNMDCVLGLQNGMISPVYENGNRVGRLKDGVKRVCAVLNIDAVDAFPRYFCKIIPPDQDLTEEQIQNITHVTKSCDPESEIIQKELFNIAQQGMTERQKDMLTSNLAHGESLQDIGARYLCHRERVRQIVGQAMRKALKNLAAVGESM